MFKIEKEMQAAIRRDLGAIETALAAVDDGIEVTTATGRVDILARDATGILTAIELKAGPCPSGALEQVLGYAQALSDERNEEVRAILIAGSFNDRQKAASKRAVGLVLKTYTYQMSYSDMA
jgi:RecB family endonuclease NucS